MGIYTLTLARRFRRKDVLLKFIRALVEKRGCNVRLFTKSTQAQVMGRKPVLWGR